MVIGPGRGGISAFVTLADGEFLPANMNSENVLVFRCGKSTDRKLLVIKDVGKLADPSLLREAEAPICNMDRMVRVDADHSLNPLHQHADGSWWFYEEQWKFEHGPFSSMESGHAALLEYCDNVLKERDELEREQ